MGLVRRQSTGRHDTVDMRMVLQVLPPRVQDTEEADVSTKVLRIGGDLKQRFRAGVEQNIVKKLLVLQDQR